MKILISLKGTHPDNEVSSGRTMYFPTPPHRRRTAPTGSCDGHLRPGPQNVQWREKDVPVPSTSVTGNRRKSSRRYDTHMYPQTASRWSPSFFQRSHHNSLTSFRFASASESYPCRLPRPRQSDSRAGPPTLRTECPLCPLG